MWQRSNQSIGCYILATHSKGAHRNDRINQVFTNKEPFIVYQLLHTGLKIDTYTVLGFNDTKAKTCNLNNLVKLHVKAKSWKKMPGAEKPKTHQLNELKSFNRERIPTDNLPNPFRNSGTR